MIARPAARAEVVVEASPDEAFRIFTDEIGLWWRRDTPYWNDRERGLTIRIEPRVGGRFLEVYDLESGTGLEVGRVTAWDPGERLAMTWTQVGWPEGVSTDIEVGNPQEEGSMSVFTTRAAAEEFVKGDPFALNGVIRNWRIREWDEVLVPDR